MDYTLSETGAGARDHRVSQVSTEIRLQSSLDEEFLTEQHQDRFSYSAADLVKTILIYKRFILVSTLVGTLLALIVSFLLKSTYTSTTILLPPRQEQSISALLSGSASGLATIGGAGALGSIGLSSKNPNDVYVSFLTSRSLTTSLVDAFNLRAFFRKGTTEEAIKALGRHTVVELGKDNLIRITVTTTDRSLSSRLANAYVDKLHTMNTVLAVDESAQRRAFYQQQLDEEKELLARAETVLQEIQARTGIIQPSNQAEMVSRNIANVRAQLTTREAERQSLQVFDAPENPEYLQLNAQISSLQHELATLENSNRSQTPGNVEIPTAQLPKAALEYARGLRDVQLHEQLYALLVKQFEAAKIDEAKTSPIIQVMDKAIPAERRSGPNRWLITLGTCAAILLLNLFWCAVVYVQGVIRQDLRS